jgi:hypothetical protein
MGGIQWEISGVLLEDVSEECKSKVSDLAGTFLITQETK